MEGITNVSWNEWFLNAKRIPDKKSIEYKPFFDFHKKLCMDGCMMGGVFFSPFLYWHINIWKTELDFVDDLGRISQKYANPYLRDNEWIVTNAIHQAHQERKGLVILGIRRSAKSVMESSYIAQGATFDRDSQNVIAGLNAPDIALITDKIDKGLNMVPDAWRYGKIQTDWKKQVTLGIKTKNGDKIPFSQILIRNLDGGANEEAVAGTKPRRLIIDEIGKGSFLKGLQAAIPGFTTPFGWGCSPILTGTGGDMKVFQDAKSLMFDVENLNFLEFRSKEDRKAKHGLFLGHTFRLEAKVKTNLGAFLETKEDEEGNLPDKKPDAELYQVPMYVGDPELADKVTDDKLTMLKNSGDRTAYLKEKMYYPKTVKDIFLNNDTNIFDAEAADRQKTKLLQLGIANIGTAVTLYDDGEGVRHDFSDKLPITNFPLKNTDTKDAPVVIYEFPMENAPYGLYVAGIDPYRQGLSEYSDSLGSVYIYKRRHALDGEKYQDMFVASYSARPDNKGTWEEQARYLIKYYNARALCENDEISFIDYMIAKNDAHYLEPQPKWLSEIVPNSKVKRDYGIHRSATKIVSFLHGCLKKYTEEEVVSVVTDEGVTVQVKGMTKILDPLLLEEITQYNETGNFDRIIAAELALGLANKLGPMILPSSTSDPRLQGLNSRASAGKGMKIFGKTLKNRPSSSTKISAFGSNKNNRGNNKLFR